MSAVPGINAKHAVITPECRANKTAEGALEEAFERIRASYRSLSEAEGNVGAKFHVVLSVEHRT